MSTITERLDKLRSHMQEPDFLEGKGLSNEVNIRIFCYDAKDEMTVRHFVEQVTADPTLACRIYERNLYSIFLSLCEENDIMDGILEMEESDGADYLLEQLQTAFGVEDYIAKIQYGPHRTGDILMLTGVGDAFPFRRVHSLLEALQSHFDDIPILVMYPGSFDGSSMRLFNTLTPNSYYRAFNEI